MNEQRLIFPHFNLHVEKELILKYTKWSPSVCRIDEAISQINNSKIGNWGQLVKIEGDFSNLYLLPV